MVTNRGASADLVPRQNRGWDGHIHSDFRADVLTTVSHMNTQVSMMVLRAECGIELPCVIFAAFIIWNVLAA